MKTLFFDAGNTVLLFDYGLVARIVSEAGFPVSPQQVLLAEYRARFDVDEVVAPYLINRLAMPPMSEVIPYGNFLGHLIKLLGVPGRLWQQIVVSLRSQSDQLWSVVAPGTREALHSLAGQGFPLHVISNSDGSVERQLINAGLRDCFGRVFDSGVVGLEKPDPAFFQHALTETGSEARNSIYFGDFYSIDYLGARNVGMQSVLFDRADLYKHVPCTRITSISQVISVV